MQALIIIIIGSLILAGVFFWLNIPILCGIWIGVALMMTLEILAFWMGDTNKRGGHDKFA